MTTAIKDVEWEQSLLEPRPCPDLEQRFARETGRPSGMMRFVDGSSWLGDAVVRLSVELENRVSLEPGIADEAGLS